MAALCLNLLFGALILRVALQDPTELLVCGARPAQTIPLASIWTMEAHYQAGWTTVRSHEAPMFFPDAWSLARGEAMVLPSLLFGALRAVGCEPLAAYNALLLFVLAANGMAGFAVGRSMRANAIGSVTLGVIATGLPFALSQIGVLQLTLLFAPAMALVALQRVHYRCGWSDVWSLCAWSLATWFSCAYFAVFLATCALIAVGSAPSWRRDRKALFRLAVAALLLLLALLPTVQGHLGATSGRSFQAGYVERQSATWHAYLPAPLRRASGSQTPYDLFPGVALVILAALGLARGVGRDSWTATCLACVVVAGLVSFGPRLALGSFVPFELLQDWWPGLDRIRSPYRAGAFVQLAALFLAGRAFTSRWLRSRPRCLALAAPIACVVVLASVNRGAPAELAATELRSVEPWADCLAGLPRAGVVTLPASTSISEKANERVVRWMLLTQAFELPLVDGYATFPPAWHRPFQQELQALSPLAIESMRMSGTRWVLIAAEDWSVELATEIAMHPDELQCRRVCEAGLVWELLP